MQEKAHMHCMWSKPSNLIGHREKWGCQWNVKVIHHLKEMRQRKFTMSCHPHWQDTPLLHLVLFQFLCHWHQTPTYRFSHILFLAHRVTQLSPGLWTKCEASVSAVQYTDIDSHSEVACELHVQLRQVYTRDFIPANKSHIPAKDTAL